MRSGRWPRRIPHPPRLCRAGGGAAARRGGGLRHGAGAVPRLAGLLPASGWRWRDGSIAASTAPSAAMATTTCAGAPHRLRREGGARRAGLWGCAARAVRSARGGGCEAGRRPSPRAARCRDEVRDDGGVHPLVGRLTAVALLVAISAMPAGHGLGTMGWGAMVVKPTAGTATKSAFADWPRVRLPTRASLPREGRDLASLRTAYFAAVGARARHSARAGETRAHPRAAGWRGVGAGRDAHGVRGALVTLRAKHALWPPQKLNSCARGWRCSRRGAASPTRPRAGTSG